MNMVLITDRLIVYVDWLDFFWVMPHCGCELTAAGRPLEYSKTIY
jgi:hypothetical protein